MSEESILYLFLGIVFFSVFMYFIFYIVRGIGLSKIAKNNGYENIAILSFVPIANIYLLGELIDGSLGERGKHNEGYLGLGLFFGTSLFGLPFIYTIYYFYMNHMLFERLGLNAVLHTVINLITLGTWFYLAVFVFRNNKLKNDNKIIENSYSVNIYDNSNEESNDKINLLK